MNEITWLGHASFKIKNGLTLYIDPWNLEDDGEEADLILITHEHFDHLSPADIEKIRGEKTVIVTIPACAASLKGDVKAMKAGEKIRVGDVEIEAIPAYNINKTFHQKSAGRVGFIITMGGERIYHAGDSDLIPEMESIKVDVALLPVGGVYTMSPEEAARAANLLRPKLAIPMHWGSSVVGKREDAERFKELCDVPVEIKDPPKTGGRSA
jgi:L-ascorbate metabolism protein UlaG (beta-lactamase superfamily)